MTPEQKKARLETLQACSDLLAEYLTDFLTDTDDPDGLVDGRIEGFEHVDPEVDNIRSKIQELIEEAE